MRAAVVNSVGYRVSFNYPTALDDDDRRKPFRDESEVESAAALALKLDYRILSGANDRASLLRLPSTSNRPRRAAPINRERSAIDSDTSNARGPARAHARRRLIPAGNVKPEMNDIIRPFVSASRPTGGKTSSLSRLEIDAERE